MSKSRELLDKLRFLLVDFDGRSDKQRALYECFEELCIYLQDIEEKLKEPK